MEGSVLFAMAPSIAVITLALPACNRETGSEPSMHYMSDSDLSFLRWDGYSWIGKANVLWLGESATFMVHTKRGHEQPLSEQQTELVRRVIALPMSKREELEHFLFDEYQRDIYGSIDPITWTPKIDQSPEIWSLLRQPSLAFPHDDRLSRDPGYAVMFECVWDNEHGVSVLYKDFQPV